MPRIEKVLDSLEKILDDPARAENWAVAFLEDLDARTVESYVENDKPLLPLLKNNLHLENNYVRGMASDTLRIVWSHVIKYIQDVPELRDYIINHSKEQERMEEILYSGKGTEWLNKNAEEIYDYLYSVAWEE